MTSVLTKLGKLDDVAVFLDAPLMSEERGSGEAFDERVDRHGDMKAVFATPKLDVDDAVIKAEVNRILDENNLAIHTPTPPADTARVGASGNLISVNIKRLTAPHLGAAV